MNKKNWRLINNKGRAIKDVALGSRIHIELVEEKIKTANSKVGIKPLVVVQVETTNTVVE
jgi:hypothetical protein